MKKAKYKMTITQIIALSFMCVIVIGAILLCLPISSRSGERTPPINAFFTATSATCVTGLIAYDTYTHWSIFGQIVIIVMIQIGGLGFMTVITMISSLFKHKISLHERRMLMQSAGSLKLNGITSLIKKVLIGTLICESAGAVLLAIRFCPQMGFGEGVYNAVFHSISAFCNAGFDIMGKNSPFSSFTSYVGDPLVCITLMLLIIIGGIGFMVWNDLLANKWHFKKYSLHTKVVVCTTLALILGGWILFYIFEGNNSMKDLSGGSRILASLFQSVTTRTAGFNTVDQAALSDSGSFASLLFMIIGGSPGSTAGGIKTTTFLVVLLNIVSIAKRDNDVEIFKRRLDTETVKQASAITAIYIGAIFISGLAIMAIEKFGMREIMFEIFSAIGTVGLSMGLTPYVSDATKVILLLLMYVGRIGGLSFILAFADVKRTRDVVRPTEKILIG